MTATVLAGELGLALLQVRLNGLINKYMGETAARLRKVFDSTSRMRGVPRDGDGGLALAGDLTNLLAGNSHVEVDVDLYAEVANRVATTVAADI